MRVYFYGDSLTSGFRLTNFFLDGYPQQPISHWTEQIAQHFNTAPAVNFAVPGCSNEFILKNVCQHSEHGIFKANSLIVIGSTFSSRIPVFDDSNHTVAEYHLLEKNNYLKKNNIKQSIKDYLIDYKVPYADAWEEYYSYMYKTIAKKLRLEGHKVILWHHDLNLSFETIAEASNGKCSDQHWSYKGSSDFGSFLLANLDKGFVNKKVYNEYKT